MENITTRQAILSDMETLLRFEQGIIQAERPYDCTIKEGQINYYDIGAMIAAPHIHLLLAEIDGVPAGSGYARIETARHFLKHPQHAYVGFMYTLPAHRGKGVNKKVIEALKLWAVSQGITEMVLDVYCQNTPAVKAYEKAGFIPHVLEMRMALGEE